MNRPLTKKERKSYLSISKRLVKPGSGTHPNLLRERTAHYGSPDIARHLSDVPYVIVGGLATRLYMQERMTLDADVLVAPANSENAVAALARTACERTGTLTIGGSTWRLPDGSSLDLIVLREPWTEVAIANSVTGDDDLPYIALPYLVIMKLTAGRVQDLADITRMLGGASEEGLRQIRQAIHKWLPQDAEDLESMIRLGGLEYTDST
jgi:hypothetical protein